MPDQHPRTVPWAVEGHLAIAGSVGSGSGLGDCSRVLATVGQRAGSGETKDEGEKWVELETWAGTAGTMGLGAGELDVCARRRGEGDGHSRGARRGVRDGVAGDRVHSAQTGLRREVEGRAKPPWVLDGCQEVGRAWVGGGWEVRGTQERCRRWRVGRGAGRVVVGGW